MQNTEPPLPDNPILRTANMIKALHWYCGDDLAGSTHCAGKALEWVARTVLDDSAEHLAAREELAYWLAMLAIKVSEPPFQDSVSVLRLLQCSLGISISEARHKDLEMFYQKRVNANPI